jgi:putative phage-type endonuclease
MTSPNQKINSLLEIPQYEQRSPEWFSQREGKLTSSDAATALNINPYQKPHELLFKKCGHDLKPFVGNVATLHGQKYEDYAIEKYCRAMGKTNYNFGMISYTDVHDNDIDKYYFLAGSPDGIVTDNENPETEPILLEVKCPYRRKIELNKCPKYYYPQVQLNLFICGLTRADFIEYRPGTQTEDEILNIVRIHIDHNWLNTNIPILYNFWKDVEHYREIGIENHHLFKVNTKKRTIQIEEDEEDNTNNQTLDFR